MIALVGLPGSGKTTVGRQLARRLQLPFVDTDLEIERQIGCSIAAFFDRAGEEAFRDLEEASIERLTQAAPCVLSSGGGAVIRAANRDRLRARTKVFYLRAAPEDVWRRLRHDRSRPLLQVADPLQKLRELYAARDPLYCETAHYVIETGRPSVAALVNRMVMQLELSGATLQA